MSSQNLTPFSYVVFVLIGNAGAGPHDLVRMARQGRIYSPWAESQYYAETKRLEKLGYLTSRREPGVTRPRTHYELTDTAREALAAWAPLPTPLPKIQNEGIARVLGADLFGEAPVVESLRALREELVDVRARLDVGLAVAETLPHRRKYLLLNHRLSIRLLDAFSAWVDEVEAELEG
jgi:DNA-binding PadR family transcriptional regulator